MTDTTLMTLSQGMQQLKRYPVLHGQRPVRTSEGTLELWYDPDAQVKLHP